MQTPSKPTRPSPLARALAVLDVVAASAHAPPPEEIARRAGMSRAELQAQLRILLREGLIEVSPDGQGYLPGATAQRLEALLSQNHSLMGRLQPVLRKLVADTGETVTYNALSHDRMNVTTIAVEYGSAALQYEVPLGIAKTLVAGASCKSILAWMGEDAIERVLEQQLSAGRRGNNLERPRLKKELGTIRSRGYAITHGERLPGAVGIAAAVFAARHVVCGSLVITIPELRLRGVKVKSLAEALVTQAAALSSRLGADDGALKGSMA
jgi:DNA-binding IclR family transcriptional regulator